MPVQSSIQISVIIPVFNQERFIGRCLRSILSQSMDRKEYEIIVIDDCSTDNTLSALAKFSDEIILLKQPENKGLPTALNTGIKKAKGRFIIRLDSDDYVHFEYLNILSLYMKMNSQVDAVSCDYLEVDDKEEIISRHSHEENPIGCGIMFRIEQLIEIGLYNEEQLWHEERELMDRFLKKFRISHLKFPLYRYRQHDNNMTKNDEMMEKYNAKRLKNT
jgi:glycosyltransferase involved in cell wall biosynthesis